MQAPAPAKSSSAFLLFLLLAASYPASAPATGSSLQQLQARFDRKESELEKLYATYWEIQYRLEQGDASASDAEIQGKIRELINDSSFLQQLKVARFNDPVLRRRRELFLEVALDVQISSDPALGRLIESIRKDSSAMRYRAAGRRLSRAELDNVLAYESVRKWRREAWYARADLTRLVGERIRHAIKMRNQLALRHGGQNFSDFMLHRRATSRADLARWYQQIRTSTDPQYRALLQRIQREFGIQKLAPWDIDFYFSHLTPAIEKKLATQDAWRQAEKVAAVLGFDFSRLPVSVKVTDITFGGYTMPIWYGRQIKMLVSNHRGIVFTDTILHESGHALHFSYVHEPTFILKDNYPPPIDEGLGQVMALMLYRPQIATAVYGLSPTQAEALAERYRLKSNYDLRVLMAHSEFELQAYDNPDQDFAALQDRICSKYLDMDCRRSNTWGYDPFYAAIPLYEQNYVLAEMFARQVHHALEKKFGSTFGAPAGAYLHDQFLVRGGSLTLDQILQRGTGESLTPDYLIAGLIAGAAAPHAQP